MADSCKAVNTPDTMWNFCPNMGASIFFLVLFVIITCAHLGQAILYRKAYCWVIVMSGLWQTLAYIFRTLSIQMVTSYADYAAWFVLILVAPLWTNAFVYMVVGRMVWNFKAGASIFGVKAWNFGLFFVLLDIVAFAVQAYGAGSASTDGNNVPPNQILQALHIYMGGVGLQQVVILAFTGLAVKLYMDIRHEQIGTRRTSALHMLHAVFIVLALITARIIFRICEYAKGLDSTIPSHEAYQYVLDSTPMFIALVILNVVHPGQIMRGKNSDMPSFLQRRRQRKQAKAHGTPLEYVQPNMHGETYDDSKHPSTISG